MRAGDRGRRVGVGQLIEEHYIVGGESTLPGSSSPLHSPEEMPLLVQEARDGIS